MPCIGKETAGLQTVLKHALVNTCDGCAFALRIFDSGWDETSVCRSMQKAELRLVNLSEGTGLIGPPVTTQLRAIYQPSFMRGWGLNRHTSQELVGSILA